MKWHRGEDGLWYCFPARAAVLYGSDEHFSLPVPQQTSSGRGPHLASWESRSVRACASFGLCNQLCLRLLNTLQLVAHHPLAAVMGTKKILEQESTMSFFFFLIMFFPSLRPRPELQSVPLRQGFMSPCRLRQATLVGTARVEARRQNAPLSALLSPNKTHLQHQDFFFFFFFPF